MKKGFFYSKKTASFYAMIVFFVALSYLVIFKSKHIQYYFNLAFSKSQFFISQSFQKISSIGNDYADHIKTVEKVRTYKQENEKITQKLNEQSFIESQNDELKKMLKFVQKLPDLILTTRIISSSDNSFTGKIILPIGRNEKVKEGMSVVSKVGVVGRIIDTGPDFSDVLLITDPNSRIVGFDPLSRNKMIVSGLGNGMLQAHYLDEDSKIKKNNIIFTTGEGGYFPEGLPIGKVVKIDGNNIILKPMFDMKKTFYVQVIGNYTSRGK